MLLLGVVDEGRAVPLASVRIISHKGPHFEINELEKKAFGIICAFSYVFDFFIIGDGIFVSFQHMGPDPMELMLVLRQF